MENKLSRKTTSATGDFSPSGGRWAGREAETGKRKRGADRLVLHEQNEIKLR